MFEFEDHDGAIADRSCFLNDTNIVGIALSSKHQERMSIRNCTSGWLKNVNIELQEWMVSIPIVIVELND